MEQINKIELQGRVGTARIQTFNGSRVANFSLAVETAYKTRSGEMCVDCTWFNCVLWEWTPGQLDSIVKGAPLHLHGRIRMRRYTGTDGAEHSVFEVVVFNFSVVGTEPEKPAAQQDDLPDDIL